MAQGQRENTAEWMEGMTEERFLRDLYLFMKKRDTPIERIPHLGFKQIDFYVMFRTVQNLGGYHQVTAQQLWKQVYNALDGNPRSTSAATCTRRHYERLLLPYECHLKGISMHGLPEHQPKFYGYPSYSTDDTDDQRPAKRKQFSHPLQQQSPHRLQSDLFSLPLHPAQYYHPSLTSLLPYVPLPHPVFTSHRTPAPQLPFSFQSVPPNLSERIKQPLEQLRYLAEQYKSSTGLSEPLNLSVKASNQGLSSNPASSFAPPGKNPKFLNTPSPLYTPCFAQTVKNEVGEAREDVAQDDDVARTYVLKANTGYVIDLTSTAASSSPAYQSALIKDGNTSATTERGSPKADFKVQPIAEQEDGHDAKRPYLNPILSCPSQDNGNKMEIEIPLSVFYNWLRLCRPMSVIPKPKQPQPLGQEETVGQDTCFKKVTIPTNPGFHSNSQHSNFSAVIEDLTLRPKNVPGPPTTLQTSIHQQSGSKHNFTSYKLLTSRGSMKDEPCSSEDPDSQNHPEKERKPPPSPLNYDCSPPQIPRDLAAAKARDEEPRREKSAARSPAVLMLNSNPSVLHLTSEEVMKLKKIISGSS